ncbi:MAG: DegT/DnrJ/EryC1/StrS family aminotransferase [Proteobacteria bacterium]|nr:DegT/DnrJ/EryC1/StrS family aminotransferase [Desulfobulbaceae bacterium]MBU4154112.1 DegT/DnrJ/EryC1/StrS family aminotransferase [Pseudomonadota bacterium]MDP2104821.1 DegT/DnrJ/EryC1/StrS family aminotransferase [Desulfobulbaceae bacterium]
MISHSRVDITPQDVAAVSTVVASGALAQGEQVRLFEDAIARRLGVSEGAAVQSGTAALHLALLALAIGPGDEVILPSYVCVAPLNAILYTGATPILADINPDTGNIAPEDAARRITPRTKAIIAPHLFGHPADITTLCRLGIPVVEDLAQAIGGSIHNQPLGSFGTLAICSFYATKVMTTGEGGMIVSNDPALLATIRDLRDYDEKELYRLRYNSKMTEMQAALGISQLQRLNDTIRRRQERASLYTSRLQESPQITLPVNRTDNDTISYRYVIRLKDGNVDKFISAMQRQNIICRRPVFKPLHQLLAQTDYPETDTFYQQAVSLPIYPSLTEAEQEQVIQAITNYWKTS